MYVSCVYELTRALLAEASWMYTEHTHIRSATVYIYVCTFHLTITERKRALEEKRAHSNETEDEAKSQNMHYVRNTDTSFGTMKR